MSDACDLVCVAYNDDSGQAECPPGPAVFIGSATPEKTSTVMFQALPDQWYAVLVTGKRGLLGFRPRGIATVSAFGGVYNKCDGTSMTLRAILIIN